MGKTKASKVRPKVIIDDTLVDEYISVKAKESEAKIWRSSEKSGFLPLART